MNTMNTPEMLEEFFRPKLPHIWCPGCAHGLVTKALVKAVQAVGLDRTKTVLVSGIGCSSRATGYLDFGTIHTTHGRALAYATGIKLARPELKVIVISGDGDASAIGGNHLIHAARRNIDLTLVVYQNGTYGMTGGQSAPTTRPGQITTTAPTGHQERPFDLCRLVEAAGASYVARGTAYHFDELTRLIARAIRKKGFSFVEAISSCPTYAGRMNGLETGTQALMWMKDHAVPGGPEQPVGSARFATGVLHDEDAPEWMEVYRGAAR
ncbi:MAG TPA: thiamine pyrophosphate-dependent enzyme [Symbiobacteriaceae bacterium]|nr:thiamine pyrophosphate-dependent enzyme [Symbiobacteriaceae bacterium]